MRSWFRVNQNKLYRKYSFDPHGYIIRRAKLTRSFKYLLIDFKYNFFKTRINKLYYNLKKTNKFKFFVNYNDTLKKKIKLKNSYNNFKLKDWKFNFWNKFKFNYFGKKKFSTLSLKKLLFSKKIKRWKIMGYQKFKFKSYKKKNAKIKKKHATKKEMSKKRKRLMQTLTWLRVSNIKKKQKHWWLLRVTLKKTAYFYGIKKLQKFRYINNLNNKAMGLKTYYNYKLECMLNIILFRLNVFDNIYIANNFIRTSGVYVNNYRVIYPFRFVKVNDIIKFPQSVFKKIFSIFVKRSKFNKSFLIKKLFIKKIKKFRILHLVKNFVNLPNYIEYNYKIMHFMIWRLPNRRELNSSYYRNKNLYDWSLNTQLQYN